MKKIVKCSLHGCSRFGKGFAQKLGLLLLGSSLCIALLAPAQSRAAAAITQLEYLQWLVQLSGDTGQFSANSTPNSYVDWARSRSMLPASGWQPTAALTRDVLAQTLVQFYNMKSSKNADYVRILQREGIEVPEATQISREAFVSMVDDFGFQSRTATIAKSKHSKHKTPTKKPTPKKPTKKKTPKKPTPKHP